MPKQPDRTINPREAILPRSLFVPQKDPRGNLREMVNAVFSDKFMIILSLIVVPLLLVEFFIPVDSAVMGFLEISDWIIVLLFVAEYTLKLYAAPNRWQHFKSAWHIVDLVIIILPFAQYLPLIPTTAGSPSLLLRLLRLPRMLAIGGRAVVGRRIGSAADAKTGTLEHELVIQQVDADLKVNQNLTWADFKTHFTDTIRQEWLDLHNVSDQDFTQLSKALGIAEPHFKSALVDEIYPHIDYIQKASFIFLQSGKISYPEHADAYLTISRSGFIVICSKTKIITVSRHRVDLVEKLLPQIQQTRQDNDFVVAVLYGILDRMLSDYSSINSEIELEILKIGSTPRSKLPKDFLERIYQLEKEVSRLVSNLLHFKDMLSIITSKKVPLTGFNEDSEEAFQVLHDRAEYLNEMSHDMIENLRSTIDLYINQTSFEANRILKILAVITAISVIPSAVSGLLGTNMLDVPYDALLWQLSFVIAVSMTFVAYTFVKLGWLKT